MFDERYDGDADADADADAAGGYNRPRRPDAETIAYLRGLPLDVEASKQEVQYFLFERSTNNNGDNETQSGGNEATRMEENEIEYPQSLAAALSAIDEIQKEVASLAGDEHGSQCIEVLAHIAAPYSPAAARVLLSSCSGYHLHLATHRYGSHVVQTILQLALSSSSSSFDGSEEQDLAFHEEAPPFMQNSATMDTLPTLEVLIHGMVEELAPHASQLAVHVCGSHVLRTLLCVLGGVDLLSSEKSFAYAPNIATDTGAILRGRKKSKKKKKRKSTSGDNEKGDSQQGHHAGVMSVVYRENSRIETSEFVSSLESIATSLMGGETNDEAQPGDLQQLSCHPSAGPLLIVLLRVLTYSTDSAKKAWSKEKKQSNDANTLIADFRLGIGKKEPTFEVGSLAHRLVKRLLCWKEGAAKQEHTGDIIYGLSGEPRGSHLLETMLRLSPDDVHASILDYGGFAKSMQEYVEHDLSNFVIQTLLTTIRSREQAESILKVMEKVISNGFAVDPTKKRRGILWRSIELAAKYRVGQEGLLKAIRLGFGAVKSSQSTTNQLSSTSKSSEGTQKKKQRKKASSTELKDCVMGLIDFRLPDQEGGRIYLDAAGCRATYHLLRFSPRLCEEILMGITEGYDTDDLLMIARDGLGSRCLFDGILEGPVKTPAFITAVKALQEKLQGHWVSLSTDRVGQHTVKKMFQALPKIGDKAKLVEELANGGNRLSGNAMGRSVAEVCLVDEYRDDSKNWRTKVSKKMSKEERFLSDLTKSITQDTGEQKSSSSSKRKRKRKKTKTTDSSLEGEDDSQPAKKQNNTGSSVTVDSIMQALTVPKS